MNAITITIGRNVGGRPLSDGCWSGFKAATRAAVADATDEIWADATYTGSWEGVSEDAALYFGPARSAAAVEVLRQRLAVLASRYGQDAIGLAVGTAELVEALQRRPVADLLARHAELGRSS